MACSPRAAVGRRGEGCRLFLAGSLGAFLTFSSPSAGLAAAAVLLRGSCASSCRAGTPVCPQVLCSGWRGRAGWAVLPGTSGEAWAG